MDGAGNNSVWILLLQLGYIFVIDVFRMGREPVMNDLGK